MCVNAMKSGISSQCHVMKTHPTDKFSSPKSEGLHVVVVCCSFPDQPVLGTRTLLVSFSEHYLTWRQPDLQENENRDMWYMQCAITNTWIV